MDTESLLPLPPPVFHILIALAEGPRHGYAIMREVSERTKGGLRLGPGTLYGSIKRMLEQGLIEEAPAGGEAGDERRRYYSLTRRGRRTAGAEAARLSAVLREAKAHGLLPQRG
jgi:DNA-binding PadR family transcriptional regulator